MRHNTGGLANEDFTSNPVFFIENKLENLMKMVKKM